MSQDMAKLLHSDNAQKSFKALDQSVNTTLEWVAPFIHAYGPNKLKQIGPKLLLLL